jgi:hypothetical protein
VSEISPGVVAVILTMAWVVLLLFITESSFGRGRGKGGK